MILNFFYKIRLFYSKIICRFRRVEFGRNVIFNGVPFILMSKRSRIVIGKNTLINSSNRGYHINMYSKCKLYVDSPSAKISIGENCRIHGACIHAQSSIIIGNNCLIAANTNIIDSNGHDLAMHNPKDRLFKRDIPKKIVIEDCVWIAANCIILGGSKIGYGSIITAGSVIRGEVPPNCIFGGNPAKLIKQY